MGFWQIHNVTFYNYSIIRKNFTVLKKYPIPQFFWGLSNSSTIQMNFVYVSAKYNQGSLVLRYGNSEELRYPLCKILREGTLASLQGQYGKNPLYLPPSRDCTIVFLSYSASPEAFCSLQWFNKLSLSKSQNISGIETQCCSIFQHLFILFMSVKKRVADQLNKLF